MLHGEILPSRKFPAPLDTGGNPSTLWLCHNLSMCYWAVAFKKGPQILAIPVEKYGIQVYALVYDPRGSTLNEIDKLI